MNTKELLKSKNIKPTIQRIKIYEYLKTHKTHPDAETIYADLIKELPTLSLSTVYNTLKEFANNGLILEVFAEHKTYFDGYNQPHNHYICDICGKVYDINIEFNFLKKKKISGHLIKKFCGIFRGICSECQKKREQK